MDAFFHREELENRPGDLVDDDQEMNTDTEAAVTVRRLKVNDPVATVSLQRAVCDTLAPATAPRPQEPKELHYDSDDSVLDLDEEYPGLGEQIIEWHRERHIAKECQRKGTHPTTLWPTINLDALLTNEEENLKLEQISATHPGTLDLLGDPGNPLYLSLTAWPNTLMP